MCACLCVYHSVFAGLMVCVCVCICLLVCLVIVPTKMYVCVYVQYVCIYDVCGGQQCVL